MQIERLQKGFTFLQCSWGYHKNNKRHPKQPVSDIATAKSARLRRTQHCPVRTLITSPPSSGSWAAAACYPHRPCSLPPNDPTPDWLSGSALVAEHDILYPTRQVKVEYAATCGTLDLQHPSRQSVPASAWAPDVACSGRLALQPWTCSFLSGLD